MVGKKKHISLRTFSFLLIFIFCFLSLLGLHQQVQAQNPITILEADRIEGGQFEGKRVQKILGNVHLQSKDMEMYCDSAYQFVNESEIRAYGNIEVNTESEKIWADSLTYFTDVDFSQLRGRVVIEADSTTLFGNSVDYRFSTRVAHFIDEIRLEDQRGTLLANSGYYYREADSAEFRGNVQLVDSLQYLEGDSLFSNREAEYYELYGEVFGDDRENDSMIQGLYLESDSTGHRLLEGNDAWLKSYESDTSDTTQINSAGTDTTHIDTADTDTSQIVSTSTDTTQADTTHIRAKSILSLEERSPTDTTNIVFGYDSVRVWSTSFSSVSDTSKYNDSTNTFELWSNAKAWHDEVQLTGPYINAKIMDGDIDSLKSYPRPFSVQEDTTIDRLNQITGDTLHADFEGGSLSQIYVFSNSHLLRFTKTEEDEPDGAVDLTAPNIRIFFEEGELDSMRAMGPVEGSYLPETEQTAQRRLDGFSWNPEMRPQRPKEKMRRRFPPIPEDIFFELPRRYIEHLKESHPESKWLEINTDKETE